jgi:hypothetical protein
MDARMLARAVALGRLGLGAALLVAPGPMAAAWTGRDGLRPGARVIAAGLGARDVAQGAGTAWALAGAADPRPWLGAGALADAVDCLATLRARAALPTLPALGVSALAASGALLGAWLARELDAPAP